MRPNQIRNRIYKQNLIYDGNSRTAHYHETHQPLVYRIEDFHQQRACRESFFSELGLILLRLLLDNRQIKNLERRVR